MLARQVMILCEVDGGQRWRSLCHDLWHCCNDCQRRPTGSRRVHVGFSNVTVGVERLTGSATVVRDGGVWLSGGAQRDGTIDEKGVEELLGVSCSVLGCEKKDFPCDCRWLVGRVYGIELAARGGGSSG